MKHAPSERLKMTFWVFIGLMVGLTFLEVTSVCPGYSLRSATIISTDDDPSFGYIGEDRRTLVQWDDGVRQYLPGELGVSSERITAARVTHTVTMFGIFGQKSMRQSFGEQR